MARVSRRATPHRGEVYLVNFDPTIGSEIRSTRPAVILQNNVGNRYGSTTIVAAISGQFDAQLYPTEVMIEPPEGGLAKRCVVLLNQVRTIDAKRLAKKLGTLKPSTMERVDRALVISLGLSEI